MCLKHALLPKILISMCFGDFVQLLMLLFSELKRDYRLPNNVDPYDVTAVLITPGQLRIAAPIKNRR